MRLVLRILESLILGLFFGLLPLIFCLSATVVITGILFDTEVLGPWALWSLVPGIIIDAVFLRKWVVRAYQINTKALAVIYLFYSVVAIAMGMGIPLFNFALCIAAGLYIARRMHLGREDEGTRKRAFRMTARFCAAAMVMVCSLMALWAAVGGVIGSRFDTPFLSFTITAPVFLIIVLAGGAVLVILQYWLTRASANVTYRLHTVKAGPGIAVAITALIAIVGASALTWHALDVYRTHKRNAAAQIADKPDQPANPSEGETKK
jgi:hypothetical protein